MIDKRELVNHREVASREWEIDHFGEYSYWDWGIVACFRREVGIRLSSHGLLGRELGGVRLVFQGRESELGTLTKKQED